jgi:hypothetical protein
MEQIAWSWATERENRFMVFLLVFAIIGGLVVMGTSACHAWKADLPWLGWDLRRRRRWRSSEQEPR